MENSFSPSGPMSLGRHLANGRQSPTAPLKLFGHAKKKINDVFVEISAYIDDGNKFLQAVDRSSDLIRDEQRELLTKYATRVQGIREILSRDRMKVVFFGRTSNGKSSVINAMLRNRILPSGIGHTTNCFLQVEGCDGSEGYIITETSPNERQSVQSINHLASALSSVRLDPNTLIRICWPKDMCTLLRDDVVLVDSPGIDVSPDIDSWIDKFCLDADVFVLVANAESTLMQTEKNFFHRVSERLSKPNIFILNNRWDASASELEMMEEVKQQHMERNLAFLVDELKVIQQHEATNRVFFVSARETLVSRVNQDKGTPTPTGQLLEGFQGRIFEFANFERKFEECISQSAVETKFQQHTTNGKQIVRELHAMMELIYDTAIARGKEKQLEYREKHALLDFTDKQLHQLTYEIKEEIKQHTEEVERKVSSALTDEIRRLSALVDEFDRPFHPDPHVLNNYKKELHAHVENGLGRNLQIRCSTALITTVHEATHNMTERLVALIPDESRRQAVLSLPTHDFEMAYRLDCRNLCSDFCEDIEFRFSFGIGTLVRRFLGRAGMQRVSRGYTEIPRPLACTPQTPTNQPTVRAVDDNELMVALLTTFSSLYSGTTVSMLAIAGLIGKAAGWRVIAVCGAIYGLLYIYERLSWTVKARERAFKRQYVDYASSKLRLIIDLTSANCSHQVQQELSSTFIRLCHQVDLTKSDLEVELNDLQAVIVRLDEAATNAKSLKNRAQFIDSELNNFITQFLNADSRL
jgi:mitofusin